MIAAIILAAGRAMRMGEPKVLLRLGGRTLLAHVLAAAAASRCETVLVVAGPNPAEVRREAEPFGARVVENPRYAEGMGTSLAVGIAALPPACEGAVILLGDQPRVSAAAIDRLITAHRETGKAMILSRYGDVAGAPALFGRALFTEASALTGDAGARRLAARHPDWVTEVPLAAEEAWDVDTPEDLERLRQALEPGRPERPA